MFDRAANESVFALVSVPPQHGKTELVLHGCVQSMLRYPERTIGYASYAADFAYSKSKLAREYARRAGVSLDENDSQAHAWMTREGGGFFATGVGGQITGKPVSGIFVIDDPHKNREEAESLTMRDKVYDLFSSVALTRIHPTTSIFVIHCIAAGEPVLMADGTWKSIETVGIGDQVAALEGGRFVGRRVLAQRASGEDVVLCVKTARKSLRVNARHPFLLDTGAWKTAGELAPGDCVRVVDKAYGAESTDNDFAWLFGFLIGDGWVTSWKRRNRDRVRGKTYESRSWCLCAARSVYPDLNDRVQASIARHFGRLPRLTKFGYYRLDSNEAGRRLVALGLVGGAHGKRIPAWIFRLDRAGKEAFLRGYADADGCSLKGCHDSARISSVSRALIEDTRRLAISAGIRCGRIGSFKQCVKAPHSHIATDYECFGLSVNFARLPDGSEKVVSVEPDGHGVVYDLTVEGAETFVAGGFIVHNTRWHEDDLIGRLSLLKDAGLDFKWEVINLPAINDGADPQRGLGDALWPKHRPKSFLDKVRALGLTEYDWESMYMGRPRPRGGAVFHGVKYFDEMPTEFRIGKGTDLAYTAKTRADHSCGVVLLFNDGKYYLISVTREQLEVDAFFPHLRKQTATYPGRYRFYTSTTEKGIAQLTRILPDGVQIHAEPATVDKFNRAQPVATAWNRGQILVPSPTLCAQLTEQGLDMTWVAPLLKEVERFTGVSDRQDDQIDALAAAFDEIDVASYDGPMPEVQTYESPLASF